MDSSLFATYTQSLGEEDTACHTGLHRDCTWEHHEPQRLWEAGFVEPRGWGAQRFSREDVINLFE